MNDPLNLKPGSLVGPYKIVSLIGKGGMGAVYEAYEERLSRRVAIKFIAKEFASDKEMVKRFETESKALARIEHQHTVSVYNIGKHEGVPYIAMEFVEGQSLFGIIKANPVSLEDAIPMFIQMLAGTKALHDHNIIHRDLKPQNIIYQKNKMIKIVDFGIAKISEKEDLELTKVGTVMGSVNYMSPEVAMGRRANEQSDIRSLGVIFYEMLVGKSPYRSKQYTALLQEVVNTDIRFPIQSYSKVPHTLRKIILKMCERRRNKRYKNADEVIKDLQSFSLMDTRDRSGLGAGEAHSKSSLLKGKKINWDLRIVGALVVFLLAGFFSYKKYNQNKKERSIISKAKEQRSEFPGLPQPQLVYPEMSYKIQEIVSGRGVSLSFGWRVNSAANLYQIQISMDSSFTSVLVDKTVKELSLNGINLFSGKYYWRVKALSNDLKSGEWSSTSYLEVIEKPVLASIPIQNDTVVVEENKNINPKEKPSVPMYKPQVVNKPMVSHSAKLTQPVLVNSKSLFMLEFNEAITSRNVASAQPSSKSFPELMWNKDSYTKSEIQISDNFRFNNIIFEKYNISGNSFTWKSAKPGKYYWRVRSTKGASKSEFSLPGQFYVLVPSPKITLVDIDQKIKGMIKASVSWTPSPYVAGYRLLISSDSSFKRIIINKKLKETFDTLTLNSEKSYYIKVAAIDTTGRKASRFSDVETIKIERDLASTGPSILGPEIGMKYKSKGNNNNFLLFKWSEVPNVKKYVIQFSLDPNFQNPIYEREMLIPKYILKRDLPEGIVYWRVRGLSGDASTRWSRPHNIIFEK
ncbi:MAG: serine/threonine protein kinase [Bdellovibrionales bacterium]|nr:serine/threonine protein kinase [Bdellovibrionales bacterium]